MSDSPTRPVIAVDIDDVLFPFIDGIVDHHNRLKGTTLTAADFVTFELSKVFGGTKEEAEEVVRGFLEGDNLHLQPVEGAKEALAILKKDFDVVLVTARNAFFKRKTVEWLQHCLPDLFTNVRFAGNPHDGRVFRSKGEICSELNAELLIDDHPDNLYSAASFGIDGILFGSKAWSVLADEQVSIVPCANWQAVIDYIYHDWRK